LPTDENSSTSETLTRSPSIAEESTVRLVWNRRFAYWRRLFQTWKFQRFDRWQYGF